MAPTDRQGLYAPLSQEASSPTDMEKDWAVTSIDSTVSCAHRSPGCLLGRRGSHSPITLQLSSLAMWRWVELTHGEGLLWAPLPTRDCAENI